ncbi:hypothetical protein [Ornithinimicrobium pratense]|uniref:Uncharacterized protein n=1 Tax=Ornithinimicrobium pratense TaxID=2593973 RepID=A0A5J6V7J1_9MICO|nr:hypothetical protein [Ornithinimicrobium pratense]QFG70040.1 hypothetical protein FY030_16165 [Ornithinimicrobium pratense]
MSGAADRDRDEVDPTGIRDLLAGLPDPGPMPEDLVHRIEARLEVEHAARDHEASRRLGRHADRVVDLTAERGRRRPGRTLAWLGAAAAGLVVTATVVPQLVGGADGGDSGTAAYYPTRGQADTDTSEMHDDSAGEDAAGGGGNDTAGADESDADAEPRSMSSVGDEAAEAPIADGETDGGASPAAPAQPLVPLDGTLVLLTDLGLVEHDTLTETLLHAVDEHEASSTTTPRTSDLLSEGEATSCWRGLAATHSFDRYVAAPAQIVLPDGQREGDPVVVLLGVRDDGSARSWIMPQDCTRNPDTLPVLEGQRHG